MVRVVMGDSVLSQWRAIEGTLINFSRTQILRRRRRKVFFLHFCESDPIVRRKARLFPRPCQLKHLCLVFPSENGGELPAVRLVFEVKRKGDGCFP